ncbi:hypothetical protein [Phaffia rhodozyma]|uniref:Uncharacterized protein n=1 Tax=Phaffia rhodozyma TaxID=264483 RepID=A0A0F7SKQ5_PHARH|nr:hypothetical protein [Phaffia rhodozyma]
MDQCNRAEQQEEIESSQASSIQLKNHTDEVQEMKTSVFLTKEDRDVEILSNTYRSLTNPPVGSKSQNKCKRRTGGMILRKFRIKSRHFSQEKTCQNDRVPFKLESRFATLHSEYVVRAYYPAYGTIGLWD